MDGQDPSFALVTINQLVFEDLIRQASEQISTRIAEFDASLNQIEERIGKAAAQEMAMLLRKQLSGDFRASAGWNQLGGAGKWSGSALGWGAIAVAAGVIFLLGMWTGQFSVVVASHFK